MNFKIKMEMVVMMIMNKMKKIMISTIKIKNRRKQNKIQFIYLINLILFRKQKMKMGFLRPIKMVLSRQNLWTEQFVNYQKIRIISIL